MLIQLFSRLTALQSPTHADEEPKKSIVVKPITVKRAKGRVIYKLMRVKGKRKIVLKINNKNGKITVKKGTKKGTYKVVIKVTALGNDKYNLLRKTVTATIKVA